MDGYTTKQKEYIDSVGGDAHQSAVKIIGELQAELETKDEEIVRLKEPWCVLTKVMHETNIKLLAKLKQAKADRDIEAECAGDRLIDNVKLQAENKRLKEKIKKYGIHLADCEIWNECNYSSDVKHELFICTCGLLQILHCKICNNTGTYQEQHDDGRATLFCDCLRGKFEEKKFLDLNPDCK